MSTTFAAIRDEQVALVRALTPSVLANVPFIESENTLDFRTWANANPEASFRRFAIRDLMQFEPPDVMDMSVEWTDSREEVLVAYPLTYQYGGDNLRDLEDVLRSDLNQINDEIGVNGYLNYSDSIATDPEFEIEVLDNVAILVMRYRVRFYRDLTSATHTTMQDSTTQSFRWTTTAESDEHAVLFATVGHPNMTDATYVVSAQVLTLAYRGVQAEAKEGTQATTGFTLCLSGTVPASTVIDVIVRDR